MDMKLDQGQEMLRSTARQFLEAECPISLVRELESNGQWHSSEIWERMSDLGWLGMTIPVEYGGGGGTLLDQLVLAEEMGRALLPGPFMTSDILCGQLLLNTGNEEQKREFLPMMSSGNAIFALALAEKNPGLTSYGLTTTGMNSKDGYRINGTKLVVPYAATAEYFICGFNNNHPNKGLGLALVQAKSPGVLITPLKSIANYPRGKVDFCDVVVREQSLLGIPGKADKPLKLAIEYATLIQSVEMVGRAQKILEMVVDYSKTRVQFGRPIGSFQAVQHQCADLRVAIDVARLLVYRGACSLADGQTSYEQVAMAKVAANETSRKATATGHGIFAGISYTLDHDMQMFSARNKLAEASMGNTISHINEIALLMGF